MCARHKGCRLLLLVVALLAREAGDSYVVTSAPEGRFAYMASLRNHEDVHVCGAVLIHPKALLTAAHCFDEYSGVAARIRWVHIGAYDVDDNEDQGVQMVKISKITIHPNYTAGRLQGGYDIALLQLKDVVTGIDIPELADPHLFLHWQMNLYALEWWTHLKVIGGRPCAVNGHLQLYLKVPVHFFEDTCRGDRGGLVLLPDMPRGDFVNGSPRKDLIVGVAAFDPNCSQSDNIRSYTRVSAVRKWIDETIEASSVARDWIPGPGPKLKSTFACWILFQDSWSVVQGTLLFAKLKWKDVEHSQQNQETLFRVFTKETAKIAGVLEDRVVITAIENMNGIIGVRYKVVFPKPFWPLKGSLTGSREADWFLRSMRDKHLLLGYPEKYGLDENSRLRMQTFRDVNPKAAFGDLPLPVPYQESRDGAVQQLAMTINNIGICIGMIALLCYIYGPQAMRRRVQRAVVGSDQGVAPMGERREMMESRPKGGNGQQLEQEAAVLVGLEQHSSGESDSWESVAAVPTEEDNDESYISLDEVQQQLLGLRYNSNTMHFLQEQMEKAQGLATLESLSEGTTQLLDAALKQGHRLIRKHSQVFDVRHFYKIEDAVEAVQLVCVKIREALVEHGSQIAFATPQQCIDRDRQHLYAHLGYVLMGRHCDFGADGFREEWESLRRWHEVKMRDLNVIVGNDLHVGQRRGFGGFSQVYEGQWRRRSVAVKKMISVDGAIQLPMEEFAEVFKEASMLASLNHPCVVRLYGMTKSGWLVMELADGDLSTLWTDETLTLSTVLDILEQAASGLEYVHCRQPPLVHGDIKDRNFLYTKSCAGTYDVKLADFGLTTEARNWETDTMRNAIATPLWKAPELYIGEKPSHQSDVFSFGLIMHAAVMKGLPLYSGLRTEEALMRRKLDGQPPCLVTQRDCPQELCDLMGRCIARAPKDRPTMSEVAECLSKLPRDWQPGQ